MAIWLEEKGFESWPNLLQMNFIFEKKKETNQQTFLLREESCVKEKNDKLGAIQSINKLLFWTRDKQFWCWSTKTNSEKWGYFSNERDLKTHINHGKWE